MINGIAERCLTVGRCLDRGETAEMPGMYNGKDYDQQGLPKVVERQNLLTNAKSKEGDIILGLASNGLHQMGFH